MAFAAGAKNSMPMTTIEMYELVINGVADVDCRHVWCLSYLAET